MSYREFSLVQREHNFEEECYEYSIHAISPDGQEFMEFELTLSDLIEFVRDEKYKIISIENHPIGFHEENIE